jgi:hypothetical protein
MIDTVYVVQEEWGLITTESGLNAIGTFGCESCIGLVLKNLIGCANVSNENFAKNISTMLCTMMRLKTNDDTTLLYLIGGQDNDKLKTIILNILFDMNHLK